MPDKIIMIASTGQKIAASPAVSILNNLLKTDVPILHLCGGKAQCGTCRIRVLEGEHYLRAKTEAEKKRLQAIGNPENVRLACQTYASGDITIEILGKRGKQRTR